MLNKYYKNLSKEDKEFAIHRIATKTDCEEAIVRKVLQNYNPLMEIKENRVVINRHSYQKLLRQIHQENLFSK